MAPNLYNQSNTAWNNAANAYQGAQNLYNTNTLPGNAATYNPSFASAYTYNPAQGNAATYNPFMAQNAGYNAMNTQGAGYGASTINAANAGNADLISQGMSRYMNPYTDSVINRTSADIQRGANVQTQANNAAAVNAGAFGGGRQGVVDALTNSEAQKNIGDFSSNLRNQGFNTAATLSGQDVSNKMNMGQFNANLLQQARMGNQDAINAARQFTSGNQMQANLANQAAGNAARQFTAGNQLQTNLSNQAARNAAGQYNAGNQQQMTMQNMAARDNAGQFNASNRQNNSQFNAGSRNTAGQWNAGARNAWELAQSNEAMQRAQGMQGLGAGQQNLGQGMFDMGQSIANQQGAQGGQQQQVIQALMNAASGQFQGWAGQPTQAVNMLLSALGMNPMNQATSTSGTSSYKPGMLDWASLAAQTVGAMFPVEAAQSRKTMANPLFEAFRNMMQGETDFLGNMLLGSNSQQQPQIAPPDVNGTQQPPPQFPTNPIGQMMPMPTGTPTSTFEPPPAGVMGYEQPVSDRPTSITSKVYQGMIARGIPEHVAAGFMPNFADESGFQLGIQEHNPRGGRGGRGLYQLTGPRREQFESMYGDDYSLDNQLDFLKWELDNTEVKARDAIYSAKTPNEAAARIVDTFLRPAAEHRDSRRNKYLSGEGGAWSMGTSGGAEGVEDEIDFSGLEEAVEEEDTRPGWGTGLQAVGKGLGQMSRGDAIDISSVFEDFNERQEEARRRQMELAKLSVDEQIAQRGHRWDVAAEERGYEHDFDINKQEQQLEEDAAARERQRIAEATTGTLRTLYPDAPWIEKAAQATAIDPELGSNYAATQIAKDEAEVERQRVIAEAEPIAQMYRDKGYDDIADLAATGDLIGARTMFTDRTRTTDGQLDAAVLAAGGPQAIALARIKKLEGGVSDKREEAIIDNEATALKDIGEERQGAKGKVGQLELALELAQDPNLNQGAFDAAILPISAVLKDTFGIDLTGVDKQEIARAANEGLIPYMRIEGDIMSDTDVERYRNSVSKLGNTREANVATLQALIETERRKDIAFAARSRYFSEAPPEMVGDVAAREAFVKSELEAAGATGDIFHNVGSKDPASAMRLEDAIMRGDIKEGSAIYNSAGDIVILDAATVAQMRTAIEAERATGQ